MHISEMANKHIDTPAQVVKVGQEVKVKVMDVNSERRRISLSMKAAAAELGIEIEVDETIHIERGYENIVEKLQALGADIRRVEIPANAVSRAI